VNLQFFATIISITAINFSNEKPAEAGLAYIKLD